jgi:hypothetical protein
MDMVVRHNDIAVREDEGGDTIVKPKRHSRYEVHVYTYVGGYSFNISVVHVVDLLGGTIHTLQQNDGDKPVAGFGCYRYAINPQA